MTKRIRITFSPGGEPRVGDILSVSDHKADVWLRTHRAELVTDPPVSAGATTTGQPSEATRQLSERATADGVELKQPTGEAAPVVPPAKAEKGSDSK